MSYLLQTNKHVAINFTRVKRHMVELVRRGLMTLNVKGTTVIIVLLLSATGVLAAENSASDEETRIIMLILKRTYADGGYTVVAPETGLLHVISDAPKRVKQSKKYIAEPPSYYTLKSTRDCIKHCS